LNIQYGSNINPGTLAKTIATGKVVRYLLGYLVAVIAGFLFTWPMGANDPEE